MFQREVSVLDIMTYIYICILVIDVSIINSIQLIISHLKVIFPFEFRPCLYSRYEMCYWAIIINFWEWETKKWKSGYSSIHWIIEVTASILLHNINIYNCVNKPTFVGTSLRQLYNNSYLRNSHNSSLSIYIFYMELNCSRCYFQMFGLQIIMVKDVVRLLYNINTT